MSNTPTDVPPPRQETDVFGDPVASQRDADEYWEAYTNTQPQDSETSTGYQHLLFVAYYRLENGEWIKQGLDRHEIKNLFDEQSWPTD